jgi:hypothetical protein
MKFFIAQSLNERCMPEYRCFVTFGHKPAIFSGKKFGPAFSTYAEAAAHIRAVKK